VEKSKIKSFGLYPTFNFVQYHILININRDILSQHIWWWWWWYIY